MAGDIIEFVENYPTYQLQKTNHTLRKGSLQSLAIPESKWQEVSIDFVADLPSVGDAKDSIMTVVDHVAKTVHLIFCKKSTTTREAARLY